MENVFLTILNMSITASYLVIAIIIFRLLLRKAPRTVFCILWGLVALRLLCPISIESVLSLIPSAKTIPDDIMTEVPHINSGIPLINYTVNPILEGSLAPTPEFSANPMQIVVAVASRIWILGIIALLIYAVISYMVVYRRVRESIKGEKGIMLCDRISSPFILGIIRPKIYLPSTLDDTQKELVLSHETAHLRRLDHLWKPLGFLIMAVYWFNPLIILAYILLCRDIEIACDEKVIKKLPPDDKKAYSETLLSLGRYHFSISACPVAFGEVGVKERIKRVLSYKKPTLWIIIFALIASVVIAVCLMTNPVNDTDEKQTDTTNTEGKETQGISKIESFPVTSPMTSYIGFDVTYACVPTEESSLQHTEFGIPMIRLSNENNYYHFTYSMLSSRIISGNFERTDDKLILYVSNSEEKYCFDIVGDTFVFDANSSSEIQKFKDGDGNYYSPLEDGAVFTLYWLSEEVDKTTLVILDNLDDIIGDDYLSYPTKQSYLLNSKYTIMFDLEDDESIQAFQFESEEAARAEGLGISKDGCSITSKNFDDGRAMTTCFSWVDKPNWYLYEDMIIFYLGDNEAILSALEDFCGKPFAGYTA